jgi:class 3 adenylate cyclase
VAALREGAGRGFITLDELEQRLPLVLKAPTVPDLLALTWDLRPSGVALDRRRPPFWRRAGFHYDAVAYGLTNASLVGTWAITGHGFFWPFFPIAGWGIALGAHAVVATSVSRRYPHQPQPQAIAAGHAALPRKTVERAGSTRYVVVMFADVANSTRINEALGDQAWSNLRARHFQVLRECVATHEGSEVSSQGDGLFARFDIPVRAVTCAVEIQRRIDEQQTLSGFAPSARIGIHAGEAIEAGADLLGNTVNLAARVTAEADPGQILVTEPVANEISERFKLDDCGLRTLKGFARPRHLLSVRF